MKLIIREYLGMLRESGEFDSLIPDLLLSMNIVPLTRPQIGVRQAGVDVAAVGNDADGTKTLWLFILKRGHIGRREWDSQQQSVRQSLNEAKDVYLQSHVDHEHSLLPAKIIVATTGDLKQEAEQNWVGYVAENTDAGRRQYEFWNGDKVAMLVEQHLFDEYALSQEGRSELRRALALVGEADYDLQHFHTLLKLLLTWDTNGASGGPTEKQCAKSLITTNLALGILSRWAATEGNLRNAVLASERTLLWSWEAIRKRNLAGNQEFLQIYFRLINIYLNVTIEYFNKLQRHFHVQDGIAGNHREAILLTEQVFEQIGLISSIGLSHLFRVVVTQKAEAIEEVHAVAESLEALIKNHGCSGSPCYDGQVIDITLALLFLHATKRAPFAKEWIRELTGRLTFGFRVGRWFPISTDSFDDLMDLEINGMDSDLSKLKETSWMIPTIAQWAAILGEDAAYKSLVGLQENVLKETCFQLWYPDKDTDEISYGGPAQFESGVSEAPVVLPATAAEMRRNIRRTRTESPVSTRVRSSATEAGIPFLDFVACRHFRTPLDPAHWQVLSSEIGEVENTMVPPKEDSEPSEEKEPNLQT